MLNNYPIYTENWTTLYKWICDSDLKPADLFHQVGSYFWHFLVHNLNISYCFVFQGSGIDCAGVCVKVDWLWKCIRAKRLCPTAKFLIESWTLILHPTSYFLIAKTQGQIIVNSSNSEVLLIETDLSTDNKTVLLVNWS